MTRAFMKVISQLPMGAVIFPGIDLDIEYTDWQAIQKDLVHPFYQIARTMVEFELPLSEVRYWHVTEQMRHKSVRSRQILLREVMRPATRTSQWRRLAVDQGELTPSSLQGLKVMSEKNALRYYECKHLYDDNLRNMKKILVGKYSRNVVNNLVKNLGYGIYPHEKQFSIEDLNEMGVKINIPIPLNIISVFEYLFKYMY